jgi:8-oxo-dGTP diphosphatase
MKLATLCYLRHQGRTLMMHRIKRQGDMHYGKWNGLGGKLHPGESPEQCVVREVREESGLTVENLKLKGFLTFPSFDQWDDWYVFVFTAEGFSGKLQDTPEGHLEWIDNQKLTSLDLWEGDHVFLPWLDRPGMFSARFVYQDGKLTDHQETFYSL